MAALHKHLVLDDVLARDDFWRGSTSASLPVASIASGFSLLDEALTVS